MLSNIKRISRVLWMGLGIFAIAGGVFPKPSHTGLITGQPGAQYECVIADGLQNELSRKSNPRETLTSLPLRFAENRGQADDSVKFIARGSGVNLFLGEKGASITSLVSRTVSPIRSSNESLWSASSPATSTRSLNCSVDEKKSIIKMSLVGASDTTRLVGIEERPEKVNYIMGNDPQRWITEVPSFSAVKYESVYAGVDLLFYSFEGSFEYDFTVGPGADPNSIRIRYEGANVTLADNGDLILQMPTIAMRQRAPSVYQTLTGVKTRLSGHYAIDQNGDVGFVLSDVDSNNAVVIDPIIEFATYLGGSFGDDRPLAIAVDGAGSIYVAGETFSLDFPTTGKSVQPNPMGGVIDGFVAKLDSSGTALIYATYFGGSGDDLCRSVAVDSAGNAYLTGQTTSADFPVTKGSFQSTLNGNANAFVAKLDSKGRSLVYSTYLGGGGEKGVGIKIDQSGSAVVFGDTTSPAFPTTPGAFQRVFKSTGLAADTFISKLSPSGNALAFSTLLGGTLHERASAIALDATGSMYVTGLTFSEDFPTTPGAVEDASNGGIFITKLKPDGSALSYSTCLSAASFASAIDVDSAGNAYVAGLSGFGLLGTELRLPHSTFVTKLNSTGTALIYVAFVGSDAKGEPTAIAVDKSGNAYVTGETNSNDFPTSENAFQRSPGSSAAAKSTNQGKTWVPIREGLSTTQVNAITIDSAQPSTLYAATVSGLFKSTDGGSHWASPPNNYLRFFFDSLALNPVDHTTLYLTSSGGVFRSRDGGITAAWLTDGLPQSLSPSHVAIDPKTPSNVYISSDQGVFRSTDAGETWTESSSGTTAIPNAVVIDPQMTAILYAPSSAGIFKSTDGGSRWFPVGQDVLRSVQFRDVAVDPQSHSTVYAATVGAGVLKSTDGGNTWIQTLNGVITPLLFTFTITLDPQNPASVYAGTRAGVFKSTDRGQTWQVVGEGIFSEFIYAVAVDPTNSSVIYSGGNRATDAYLVKVNRAGTGFVFSTYLGGGSYDLGTAITVDKKGNVYVTGYSDSFNFPTTSDAFMPHAENVFGYYSGFIAKIAPPSNPSIDSASIVGNKLVVVGENFDAGSVLLVSGNERSAHLDPQDATKLVSKKAAKEVLPGQTVSLQVRNSTAISDEFLFTRPQN